MGFFLAHSTQIVTPGMAINRAGAMDRPQEVQGLGTIFFVVLIGVNAIDASGVRLVRSSKLP